MKLIPTLIMSGLSPLNVRAVAVLVSRGGLQCIVIGGVSHQGLLRDVSCGHFAVFSEKRTWV